MSPTSINPNNIFQRADIGKVRTAQEDNHANGITPNGHLFVVCDGMGGHVGGAEASKTAVNSIVEYLNKEKYLNIKKALNGALQFANTQILGKVHEYPALKGMGTTACILLLQNNEAYIVHVGDSRIYLYLGKEKELIRITKDHSYVQTLVDLPEGHSDKISDDEAENHPSKNRILKALGIKLELEPTICEYPIKPKNGDVFLLCSDGLNGMLSDSKIKQVLSFNKDTIAQKGNMLVNLALEAGGYDNITVQLVQISGSPHKKTVYKHCDFNPKPKGKPKPKSKSSATKSKKLAKIFIALSIVFLCIIGAGITYSIDKKSKEKKMERLQTCRNKAKEKYDGLEADVQKKRTEYNNAKESTRRAKDTYDNSQSSDPENFKKAKDGYDSRKNEEDDLKNTLEKLERKRETAKQEWKRLDISFPNDSIDIVNSKLINKLIKNESNNNR